MNVAHLDIDIVNPKSKKDKVAGFFDFERTNYAFLLENNNLIDIYRNQNPNKNKSTYWSNFSKQIRRNSNGWGIDYFIISSELLDTKGTINCNILIDILGSDHCPMYLELCDVL
jgi:exodeoxyribonuclease III